MLVQLILQLGCGLCWTAAYIEIIRLGLTQKTYGMPLFALALNLSWEIVATLNAFTNPAGSDLQGYVNLTWTVFDLGIAYTYVRYGRRHFPPAFGGTAFALWSLAALVTGFAVNYAFVLELNATAIGLYPSSGHGLDFAAFLGNLLMSVLFIDLFVRRQGSLGQSLLAAGLKGLGTFCAVLYFVPLRRPLMLIPGFLAGAFDLIYIGLLVRERQRLSQETPRTTLLPLKPDPQVQTA